VHATLPIAAAVLTLLASGGAAGQTAFKPCDHPFILWTRDDVAELKRRIETEPWARSAWDAWMAAKKDDHRTPHPLILRNLARWAVLGDREAAEQEKKELFRVLQSPIPLGGAQEVTILRYDLLYDLLGPDERKAFESAARVYIDQAIFHNAVFDPQIFNDSARYSRYDAKKYTRTNWLPNIIWPRKVSANLMAAALRDEDLIRKTWAAYGSWKWYFDEYLCDLGFYSEEFSKMGSTPGAMLLYCRALARLGLDDLGFGYRGKGGATMRGHIESLIHLGYPRVDLCSERPQYPMITLGDLRQGGSSQGQAFPAPAFQHALVVGTLPDGTGGNLWWRAHGAWGGLTRGKNPQWDGYSNFIPKMQIPYWFELGHALWPEIRFDYFLARMRGPDEQRFNPSLLFGVRPIDPEKAAPPPAPSAVWPQRGLVMLRADESPAYWESPAPAASMRLSTGYAHSASDSFALVGFYAFNRPIYVNRQVTPGYATGWSRGIQSHCGVTVDAAEPKTSDAVNIRIQFAGAMKYAAAESEAVYPGVALSRSLVLTREYLLDVTHLAGDAPRDVAWFIHTPGLRHDDGGPAWAPAELPKGLHPLADVRAAPVGEADWSIVAVQSCALDDPAKAKLPKAWYDRGVGVRICMLGEDGTTAYAARTPLPIAVTQGPDKKRIEVEASSEVGGLTIVVCRRAPATTFAALHEPFEGGRPGRTEFRRVAQSDRGLAVAVRGVGNPPADDRILLPLRLDDAGAPQSLAGVRERYTFAGAVRIRIGRDRVEVTGDLRAMALPVEGQPALVLDGKRAPARVEGEMLMYGN